MLKTYGMIVLVLAVGIACSRTESLPTTEKLGALATPGQVGPFVIPASWKQASWFIDNTNGSGCASDNNRTCSLSTCGTSGDGPCLTYGSVATRWGTYGPKLQQITTLTIMSNMATTDQIYFDPSLENALVEIKGTPTQTGIVTLGTVTAKNRATPQLLNAVMLEDGGSLAVGDFLINTNRANSEAWVYKNVSGTTWALTQPLAAAGTTALGLPFGTVAAENDAWAQNDTVNVFHFPNTYIARINPTQGTYVTSGGSNLAGGVYVYQVTNTGPSTGVYAPTIIGSQVALMDVWCQTELSGIPYGPTALGGFSNFSFTQETYNSFLSGGMWGLGQQSYRTGQGAAASAYMTGGAISTGNNRPTHLGFVQMEQDLILGVSSHGAIQITGGGINGVYIETAQSLSTITGQVSTTPDLNGGNATVWGPGALNVFGSTRYAYPAGAGGAAAALLLTGGLTISGGTKACVGVPTVASPTLTCNITVSATNLDSNLGGTTGCLWVEGGSSMCNSSP